VSSLAVRFLFLSLSLLVLLAACTRAPAPVAAPAPTPPTLFRARAVGTGRPVLFVGDLGAPPEVWDTIVAHLGARAQSHVIDVAGFAGHAAGAEPLLPALVEQLADYVRQARLSRPIVVGHMFGGTVAWWLAMSHPDLLGGVLVVDAPPSRSTGDPEDEAEAREARRALEGATREQFAKMTSFRLGSQMNDKTRAAALAEKAARSDRRVVADATFAMMTADTRASIPRIKTPALVLLTTENLPKGTAPEVETLYREQLAAIPEHELVVVQGSHHYVMFDAPETFFASLDRFVDRWAGPRG
jgi:pimeloyl-ACP methyl ester carboxylesterase